MVGRTEIFGACARSEAHLRMYQCMEMTIKSSSKSALLGQTLTVSMFCLALNGFAASSVDRCQLVFADSQAAILRADSVSGAAEIMSKDEKLMQPYGIAVGTSGEVFVSDTGCSGLLGVNPSTGEQRVISSGGLLGVPFGIAVERTGKILVSNGQSLLRVDPDSGAQDLVSGGGNLFQVPIAMTVDEDDNIYVVDALGAVVRVNPTSGAQTAVAKGGHLHRPQGIVASGKYVYVTDVATADSNFGVGRVIRIDVRNGHQTILSEGAHLVGPVGITVDPNGELIVSDPYTINPDSAELFDGAIIRVHPKTGAQSLIARGSANFVNPRGVAVLPN
jgi:streptogramin lyase